MILLKSCTQYASKFGKLSKGHRTGKGQFSLQSQKGQCQKMVKLPYNCTHFTCQKSNAQNSPREASTVCEQRTSRCSSWIQKRQRNQREIKLPTSAGSSKKQEFQKNIYFCFIDYAKAFDCVDHNKLENSEIDGNTKPPDLPLEKSVCRSISNNQTWNMFQTCNNGLVQN